MSSYKPVDTLISTSKVTVVLDCLFSVPTQFCQIMASIKCIMCYLKSTVSSGLHIIHSSSFALHGFIDVNQADNVENRKSISGYLVFFSNTSIYWESGAKQCTVARSSTEVEYKALVDGTVEVLQLQYLSPDLQITPTSVPMIWCDNLGTNYLFVNPIFHART